MGSLDEWISVFHLMIAASKYLDVARRQSNKKKFINSWFVFTMNMILSHPPFIFLEFNPHHSKWKLL